MPQVASAVGRRGGLGSPEGCAGLTSAEAPVLGLTLRGIFPGGAALECWQERGSRV